MKKFRLVTLLLAFLTLGFLFPGNRTVRSGQEEAEGPKQGEPEGQKTFPITIDFECQRNFGFHIGEEIPLTMILTAGEGTIIDLVNLPQKKETHGPFEVRGVKVRKRREGDRTIYTVFYRLQSFKPAIAVDRLSFPPLRISYATQADWDPVGSKYNYRSLFSQPYEVFVSRTATYFGPMRDIKGPIEDGEVAVQWKATNTVGGLLVLLALITWPWEFIRRRKRAVTEPPAVTAWDRALKALQEARESCFNYEDHRKRLFFEINGILRDFLRDVCGLDGANRPSMQLVNELKDRPYYEELKGLVTRINQVIYEGDAPVDVEPIVRQFTGLLQKVDGTSLPEGNHDKAG